MWDLIGLAAVFGLIAGVVIDAARSHSRKRAWAAAPTVRTDRPLIRPSRDK